MPQAGCLRGTVGDGRLWPRRATCLTAAIRNRTNRPIGIWKPVLAFGKSAGARAAMGGVSPPLSPDISFRRSFSDAPFVAEAPNRAGQDLPPAQEDQLLPIVVVGIESLPHV